MEILAASIYIFLGLAIVFSSKSHVNLKLVQVAKEAFPRRLRRKFSGSETDTPGTNDIDINEVDTKVA